jgi:hypothetical protein
MVLARVTVRIDLTIPSGAICVENEGHGIPGHRRHVVVVVLDLMLSIENLCESVQFLMSININMKCMPPAIIRVISRQAQHIW